MTDKGAGADLRAAVKGRVITRQDADYDKARTVFVGDVNKYPAAIVRVADADDAARVIAYARASGLELAVRSGGHSSVGHSVTEGGIVLDLGGLRAMDIDTERRTAWAQTGLTAVEYTQAAGAHGLVTGFGDTGSVGIGGITLGGGVGYLVRKYGLTIDDLLAAEVVTADGERLRADANSHPDLFWALRGGGGNFGVATRFQYRLHELPSVVGGMLVLPATAETIAGFITAAEEAPEELSAIANVMNAPPMPFLPAEQHGKLVILAIMVYAGATEAGERALAPFRKLAAPLADMLQTMPYAGIYSPDDESYHPTAVGRNMHLERVDRATAETMVSFLNASDASMRVAQLRVLGGAMARVPADATAYAHRNSRIMVNLAAFYEGPADRPRREAWVKDFAEALEQGDPAAYVGFVGNEGEAGVRSAYPPQTLARLMEVKARYDPTNLFHLNQNIRPEGMGDRHAERSEDG
jgi:FAD/FMN-containing dehydrogenase